MNEEQQRLLRMLGEQDGKKATAQAKKRRDQAHSTLASITARLAIEMFEALKHAGFSPDKAWELTKIYFEALSKGLIVKAL